MNVTEVDSDFYHDSITEWLVGGGDFVVGGKSAIERGFDHLKMRNGRKVFEYHFALPDHVWAKLAVSVAAQDPIAECFVTMGYGDTDAPQPTFERREVFVYEKPSEAGFILDESRPTDSVITCAQGQGASSAHWRFDFRSPRMQALIGGESSGYIPHDGNSTGGNWRYMGYKTPVETFTIDGWRKELYPIARYGGRFVQPGAGWPVTEADYPDAVLGNGTHFHRNTPTWIEYTDPQHPWKDKGDMRPPDDQHLSVYDALCEVYSEFPFDEAMRWEVIFAAHRFLMQIPGKDKGTFRWKPGQTRARGRVLKMAAKLVDALFAADENELAKAVGLRLLERLNSQALEFRSRLVSGLDPWPDFQGVRGRWAPHEIGVWYWGLDWAQDALQKYDIEFLAVEVEFMKRATSQFCFESFYLDDSGEIQLPYIVQRDWQHERRPSGGRHFAWLAASDAEVSTLEDERKMEALEAFGETLEDRYKR